MKLDGIDTSDPNFNQDLLKVMTAPFAKPTGDLFWLLDTPMDSYSACIAKVIEKGGTWPSSAFATVTFFDMVHMTDQTQSFTLQLGDLRQVWARAPSTLLDENDQLVNTSPPNQYVYLFMNQKWLDAHTAVKNSRQGTGKYPRSAGGDLDDARKILRRVKESIYEGLSADEKVFFDRFTANKSKHMKTS